MTGGDPALKNGGPLRGGLLLNPLRCVLRRQGAPQHRQRRPGPLRSSARSRTYRGGSASRPQHDQLTRDDLGDVARLLVVVFPSPILDPSLDVDFVALFQVLLAHVGQAGSALIIPADNSMPVRLFLLLPAISRPLPAGSQGESGHTGTVIRATHLGIGPQIPDELDLIETAAHNNLLTM